MHVSQLYIYPVKSLGGIALEHTRITGRGLAYDRRYMLVDEAGLFLTQRNMHHLALFRTALHEHGFEITYRQDKLLLPFSMAGNRQDVTVWDDEVQAVMAGKAYNDWFSEHLGRKVRLVYMDEESRRDVNPKYADNNEQVSFADGYPVLLLSEASLELLNSKLAEPVGMDRFRPNIVIRGMHPHQEDSLSAFYVGGVRFKAAKPCARCVVTTINQHTLQVSKEPLATLARYRLSDHAILFGENVICLEEGEIAVGSKLYF